MNIAPFSDEEMPRRAILPGGAIFLTRPLESAHAVALGVWLRTGAQDEPPELGGLSHFLEHIVFKGSASRSAYEIAQAFDGLGVAVDAYTNKDNIAFILKVLPEYLDPAAEILADMLLNPALAPETIRLEQDVVCEEIQEARDTPEEFLDDAFCARVYAPHPRSRTILGRAETVRSFDAELLRREHRRLFSSSNLVIAMAGNLNQAARDVVLKHFDLPSASEAVPCSSPAHAPSNLPKATNGRVELNGTLVQSYFEIGNLGVSYKHADRIPLIILANMLGGGMSSRIFQAVREREGLAYTIYTDSDMGRDIGLVSCAGACTPEKTARVEELVRQEYARLIRDGVDEAELQSNRAQFKSQLVFSLEGVVSQMLRLARTEILYGRFIPVRETVAKIDAVSRDDIARCARQYFDPDQLIVATYGPA